MAAVMDIFRGLSVAALCADGFGAGCAPAARPRAETVLATPPIRLRYSATYMGAPKGVAVPPLRLRFYSDVFV